MPQKTYTLKSPKTGKEYKVDWTKDTEPTDDDFKEIITHLSTMDNAAPKLGPDGRPILDVVSDIPEEKGIVGKTVDALSTAPKFITDRTRVDKEHLITEGKTLGGLLEVPGAIKDIIVNTFQSPTMAKGETAADELRKRREIMGAQVRGYNEGALEGLGELASPLNVADAATGFGKGTVVRGINRGVSALTALAGAKHISEGSTLGGLAEVAGGTLGLAFPNKPKVKSTKPVVDVPAPITDPRRLLAAPAAPDAPKFGDTAVQTELPIEDATSLRPRPNVPAPEKPGIPLDSGTIAEQRLRANAGIEAEAQRKIFDLQLKKSEAARMGDHTTATALEAEILKAKVDASVAKSQWEPNLPPKFDELPSNQGSLFGEVDEFGAGTPRPTPFETRPLRFSMRDVMGGNRPPLANPRAGRFIGDEAGNIVPPDRGVPPGGSMAGQAPPVIPGAPIPDARGAFPLKNRAGRFVGATGGGAENLQSFENYPRPGTVIDEATGTTSKGYPLGRTVSPTEASIDDFLKERGLEGNIRAGAEAAQPTRQLRDVVDDFVPAAAPKDSLLDKIRRQPQSEARDTVLARLEKKAAEEAATKAAADAKLASENRRILDNISPVEKVRIAGRNPQFEGEKAIFRGINDVERARILARADKRAASEVRKAVADAKRASRANKRGSKAPRTEDTMEARIAAAEAVEAASRKGGRVEAPPRQKSSGGTTMGSGFGGLQPLYEKFKDTSIGGRVIGKVEDFGKKVVEPFKPDIFKYEILANGKRVGIAASEKQALLAVQRLDKQSSGAIRHQFKPMEMPKVEPRVLKEGESLVYDVRNKQHSGTVRSFKTKEAADSWIQQAKEEGAHAPYETVEAVDRGRKMGLGYVDPDGKLKFAELPTEKVWRTMHYEKFPDALKKGNARYRLDRDRVVWTNKPSQLQYDAVANQFPHYEQFLAAGIDVQRLGSGRGTNVGMFDLTPLGPIFGKLNKKSRKVLQGIADRFEQPKPGKIKSKEKVQRLAPINTDTSYGRFMKRLRENTTIEAARKFNLKEWHADQATKMKSVLATGEQGTIQRAAAMEGGPGDIIFPPLKLEQTELDQLINAAGLAQKDAQGRIDIFKKQRAEQAVRRMNRGEYVAPAERRLMSKAFPEQYRTEIQNLYSNIPYDHIVKIMGHTKGTTVAFLEGLRKWTLGSSKTLKAAFDASFVGVQARGAMFTKGYYKAFKPAWEALKSQDGFKANLDRIQDSHWYDVIHNDMGIHIADLEKKTGDLYLSGNPTLDKLPPIKAAHRAATTFLNEIRFQNGITQAKLARKRGILNDDVAMKGLGKAINEATGYGTLSEKYHVAQAERFLANAVWSPRLTASRLNYLQLFNPAAYKGSRGFGQRQRLKSATTVALSSLAAMKFLEEAGGFKAHWSPFDPSFGKVEKDGEFIDTTGGFGAVAALTARSLQAMTIGGLRDRKGNKIASGIMPNATELMSAYGENKLTPTASWGLKLARQKNPYTGKPYNIPAESLDLVVPLFADALWDIGKDIINEDESLFSIIKALPAFSGVNMYDVDKKESSFAEDAIGLTGYEKPKKTLFSEIVRPVKREIRDFSRY